ncbi:hypothetical protein G6F43_010480 [Rhizopus delemar]|nr:hypothetical protein G6F43_010480 [Rhizopus delemar]
MASTISVIFDDNQVHCVQLLPEKLNWNNLVTVLQLSAPQASNRDSLVFYCRLPETNELMMISNQSELEEVINRLKMSYNHLRFYENMKNAGSVIEVSPFEKLAQFVKQHQPLEYHVSYWVGNLASQMSFSPEISFDRELLWLEKALEVSKNEKDRQKRHDDDLEDFTFVGSEKKEDTDTSSLESEDGIPNFAKEVAHSPPPSPPRFHHHAYPHIIHHRHYHPCPPPPSPPQFGRRFDDSRPFDCFKPFGDYEKHFHNKQFGFGGHFGREGQLGKHFGKHGRPFGNFDGHARHPPFSFHPSNKPFCKHADKESEIPPQGGPRFYFS